MALQGSRLFLALGSIGAHTHIVGGLGPVGGEGLGGGALLHRKVQKIPLKILGGGVLHLVAAARDFAPLNRDLLRLRRVAELIFGVAVSVLVLTLLLLAPVLVLLSVVYAATWKV